MPITLAHVVSFLCNSSLIPVLISSWHNGRTLDSSSQGQGLRDTKWRKSIRGIMLFILGAKLLVVCERLMNELDTSCERDRSNFFVFSVIREQARLELGMKFVGLVLSSCLTMNSSKKLCSKKIVGTSWKWPRRLTDNSASGNGFVTADTKLADFCKNVDP